VKTADRPSLAIDDLDVIAFKQLIDPHRRQSESVEWSRVS
jgi:hypothetical protein